MLERAPGIYEVELHSNQKSISEIKIFLIPGRDGGRSLMVDAGFRKTDNAWNPWRRPWPTLGSLMINWIFS